MLPICGAYVAAFCNCSGLNGLAVTPQNPAAAVTTSATGSQDSRNRACRIAGSRANAMVTPLNAKPTMTMEITQ